MPISAIRGVYHNGREEPLENIPYMEDKEVVIVFLENIEKDGSIWDESVAKDFLRGYS